MYIFIVVCYPTTVVVILYSLWMVIRASARLNVLIVLESVMVSLVTAVVAGPYTVQVGCVGGVMAAGFVGSNYGPRGMHRSYRSLEIWAAIRGLEACECPIVSLNYLINSRTLC